MTCMATPQHKTPYPGVHEIYNFGRPFLGHHYFIHSLSDLCLEVEKIFKKYIIFTLFTQNYLPLTWGAMKCTISCLLIQQMPHTIFGQDLPSSSWEEDVNRQHTPPDGRRTPAQTNRSPEWFMWPKTKKSFINMIEKNKSCIIEAFFNYYQTLKKFLQASIYFLNCWLLQISSFLLKFANFFIKQHCSHGQCLNIIFYAHVELRVI